jgi:hypothetical protein
VVACGTPDQECGSREGLETTYWIARSSHDALEATYWLAGVKECFFFVLGVESFCVTMGLLIRV